MQMYVEYPKTVTHCSREVVRKELTTAAGHCTELDMKSASECSQYIELRIWQTYFGLFQPTRVASCRGSHRTPIILFNGFGIFDIALDTFVALRDDDEHFLFRER